MAQVTLGGNPVNTMGELPEVGSSAADFLLANQDLKDISLAHYHGQKVILNIYPSIDTGICAMSTTRFNKEAAELGNTRIVCVSKDLPFAFKRYCSAEGIDKIDTLSSFRDGGDFGRNYGVELIDGPMKGLNARAIVVLDENATVVYNELVSEIGTEPDYEKALAALG